MSEPARPPTERPTRPGFGSRAALAVAGALVAGGASYLAGGSLILACAIAFVFGGIGLIPESLGSRVRRWFDRFFLG